MKNLEEKVEKLAGEWQRSLVNPEWTEQMLFMNFMAYCTRPSGGYNGGSIYGGAVAKENPEKHLRAYKEYLQGELKQFKASPEEAYYKSALKKISSAFPELD